MNLKPTKSNTFRRKTFCITLVLFFSLNFFAGAALAKSCDGGAGCLSCAQAVHPHMPGMGMAMTPLGTAMAPLGCLPLDQKDGCSFEIGSGPAQFHGIIPAVRIYQSETGEIFSANHVDDSPALTAAKFSLPHHYSDTQPTTPIFLIIHSLLC
jgi:hypothetical protein